MSTITRQTLLDQLTWRYATKKFDPTKKIPADVWGALEESLVLSPSSFGLQPYKFVIITNQEIKKKLVEHSYGQTQLKDSSHVVVFAIRTDLDMKYVDKYINLISTVRGAPLEALNGFKDVLLGFIKNPPFNLKVWAARQAYIALGNFMDAAALLGVDTCPMEGIVPPKYDEILGLASQNLATVVVATAGYRAADDQYASLKKVRFDRNDLIVRV